MKLIHYLLSKIISIWEKWFDIEIGSNMVETQLKSQFILKRLWFDNGWTIGELHYLGDFLCYTLEDTVRSIKIPHVTAISPGKYEMILSYSNRFQTYLPLLLNVPLFDGVRIHAGNRPKDTDGCILVGNFKGEGYIGESRKALSKLMEIFEPITKRGKVYIEIIGGMPFN